MQHKPELEDTGFTRQVMNRLPDRASKLNRIWSIFCMAIGLLFMAVLWVSGQLGMVLSNLIGDIIGVVVSDRMAETPVLTICLAVLAAVFMLLHNLVTASAKEQSLFAS